MMLSSWSTSSIEDVAQASGSGLRWFQLYMYRDKELTKNLVLRAERAGYIWGVISVKIRCLVVGYIGDRVHILSRNRGYTCNRVYTL